MGETRPQADGCCTFHKLEVTGRSCPELQQESSVAAIFPSEGAGWGLTLQRQTTQQVGGASTEGGRTSGEEALFAVLLAQPCWRHSAVSLVRLSSMGTCRVGHSAVWQPQPACFPSLH